MNIDMLQRYIHQVTAHSNCDGSIVLTGEMRQGLASILYSECTKCGHKIQLDTSDKVVGPKGYNRWECNLAAVWGQMVTGGGHACLQETLSVLGIPSMTKKTFMSTERDIGEFWKSMLQDSMSQAGKEEKQLAERRGDFHQGVPAITVILDGGWSKRSHRHSYNAKSGVAVIFGQKTGKLLYLDVRNKYCTTCEMNIPKDRHECYKNWNLSSSQMETDIILEGFKLAEKMHGVRYMRFIGDGDSSVHSTLLQCVPLWGRDITKLECANHAVKCYRSSLEKLVQDKPSYKGKGGLTLKMRKCLSSAARCAIKMHSKEADRTKAVRLLRQDLANGPLHCFGRHEKCSKDFCKVAQEMDNTHCTTEDTTGETEYRETKDQDNSREMDDKENDTEQDKGTDGTEMNDKENDTEKRDFEDTPWEDGSSSDFDVICGK